MTCTEGTEDMTMTGRHAAATAEAEEAQCGQCEVTRPAAEMTRVGAVWYCGAIPGDDPESRVRWKAEIRACTERQTAARAALRLARLAGQGGAERDPEAPEDSPVAPCPGDETDGLQGAAEPALPPAGEAPADSDARPEGS